MVNVTVSSAGIQGPQGFSWRSGAGAPATTTGVDGDFYLDTTNVGYYYGPKTAGAWGTPHPFGNSLNGVPLGNYTATTDPTAGSDSTLGYSVGSVWINTSAVRVFTAVSVAVSAAIWVENNQRGYLTQTPASAYSMTALDRYILANAAAAAFAVTLISSATAPNAVTIKKTDTTNNPVTLTPQAGQTIDGASTYVIASPNQSATLIPNGSAWYVV